MAQIRDPEAVERRMLQENDISVARRRDVATKTQVMYILRDAGSDAIPPGRFGSRRSIRNEEPGPDCSLVAPGLWPWL